MTASSSIPSEGFLRPRERLEERREEGEEDLKEEFEPLLFSAEVKICNADVGRLLFPLVSSSLPGEIGGTASVALTLFPKREDRLRWWV